MAAAVPGSELRAKLGSLAHLLKETEQVAKRYLDLTRCKRKDRDEDDAELLQFDESLYNKLMKVYMDAKEVLGKDESAIDGTLDKLNEIQKPVGKRKTKGEPASPAASKGKPKKVKKERAVSPIAFPASVGDLVAARNSGSDQWILAKVTQLMKGGRYEVEDAAPEEDEDPSERKFICTADNIIALPPDPGSINLENVGIMGGVGIGTPGGKSGPVQYLYNAFPAKTPVLGMFPHTTTFYPATVMSPHKKGKLVMFYQLQFEDDQDDHTHVTPSRKVSAQYVIPYSGY